MHAQASQKILHLDCCPLTKMKSLTVSHILNFPSFEQTIIIRLRKCDTLCPVTGSIIVCFVTLLHIMCSGFYGLRLHSVDELDEEPPDAIYGLPPPPPPKTIIRYSKKCYLKTFWIPKAPIIEAPTFALPIVAVCRASAEIESLDRWTKDYSFYFMIICFCL